MYLTMHARAHTDMKMPQNFCGFMQMSKVLVEQMEVSEPVLFQCETASKLDLFSGMFAHN